MEAETNDENTPTRLPFDIEFFRVVEQFSDEALNKVPELHGVAIIPLWTNQPENIPAGLLRLRDTTPPYMASLLRLLASLSIFSSEVNKDLINQIKMFDGYAAKLAETIKERTEALNTLPPPNDTKTNG
jgi:hypothetical protein